MSESPRAKLEFSYKRVTDAHYEGLVALYAPDGAVAEDDLVSYQGDRAGWVRLVVEQIKRHPAAQPVFWFGEGQHVQGIEGFRLSLRTVERIITGELSAADILL